MPPFTPHAGRMLGPYELVRPLGEGGSAEVWEALLCGPGGFRKPVALKMLKDSAVADPQQQALLLREARLGARLQHPNVVCTLLVGEHEGRLCIALELVRGCSAQVLQGVHGRLPARALLDLGEQTAAALHHIHTFEHNGIAAGLVHRDIKPGNLLIDVTGIVKLADLGICVPLEETGNVAGTHGYMSPEQITDAAEPRSDLFGLGSTLYLLATGRRPFGRGLQACAAVLDADARLSDPAMFAPVDACVPGLAAIVQACLRQSANDRPADALAVAKSLAALRAHAPDGPTLRELVTTAAPQQATSSDAPSTGPTYRSLGGNLRPVHDTFVGRRSELAALKAQVRTGCWVVLLGPGGMGKTRLALELGQQKQDSLSGGAWAFDLSEARLASDICQTIAAALAIPLGEKDPAGQIGHLFASKGPCLVVLDNLEQCVGALPNTVDRWRAMAPEACFVGTSRIRPGLAGEDVLSVDVLQAVDAIQLFETRAQRPLTDPERALLPALCSALEHIPLPIELAAARVGLLPVKTIAERLSLDLLSTPNQDRPPRQRSVQASLTWSWELLSPPAQRALGQLCVFDGPFTLSAAEAILDLGPDAPWALGVLQELVDASLLRVLPHTFRFVFWTVVKQFGARAIDARTLLATEVRHGAHFARVDPMAAGADMDNLVGACRRAVLRGDAPIACATLEAAGLGYLRRGPASAWLTLAQQVVQVAQTSALACRGLLQVGSAALLAGRIADAHEPLTQGLREAVSAADRHTEARLRSLLGEQCRRVGRPSDAMALFEAALPLHRAVGDVEGEALTQWRMGVWFGDAVRFDDARRCIQAAIRLDGSQRGERWLAPFELALGGIELKAGNMAVAQQHYEHTLALAEAQGDVRTAAVVHNNLGTILGMKGDYAGAQRALERALQVHRQVGDRWTENATLGNLALVQMWQGQFDAARGHIQRAVAFAESISDAQNLGFLHLVGGDLGRLSGSIDEARHHLAQCLVHLGPSHARRWEVHILAARLDLYDGLMDSAQSHLQRALASARQSGNPAQNTRQVADVRLLTAQAALHHPPSPTALQQAHELLQATREAYAPSDLGYTRWWCIEAVRLHHLAEEGAARSAFEEAFRVATPHVAEAGKVRMWAEAQLEPACVSIQSRSDPGIQT